MICLSLFTNTYKYVRINVTLCNEKIIHTIIKIGEKKHIIRWEINLESFIHIINK